MGSSVVLSTISNLTILHFAPQEHGVQPELDRFVGAATPVLVLTGRRREDVPGQGQGRGGLSELHSDTGEPGAGSIADLRNELVSADVSPVPGRRAELHRGLGEERTSRVSIRSQAQFHGSVCRYVDCGRFIMGHLD